MLPNSILEQDPEAFLYVAQHSIKNNVWTNFIP